MGRPTKPRTKMKQAPEGADSKVIWKNLREAVSKATKETLEAPVITNRLPTGLTFLDTVLGGGLPGGRCTMIHGAEGGLKSTFLDHIGAQAQRLGGYYWKANPEDSHNDKVFELMGASTDPTQFMYTRPLNIEEWLLSLDKFLESGICEVNVPVVIGLDTLAMLAPKKEGENNITHSGLPMGTPGKLAQYFRSTDALKRLTNSWIYLVILQQHRDQVGGSSWGPTEKVPGGRSLRHYLSTRLELSVCGVTEAKENGITLKQDDNKNKKFLEVIKVTMHKLRDEINGRSFYVPYFFRRGWQDSIGCFDFLYANHYLETKGNYILINGESKLRKDWYKLLLEECLAPVDPKAADLHKIIKEMGGQAFYQEFFDSDYQEDRIL